MRFTEFKPDQEISEVNMSPTFLKQWSSSKSAEEALMGFEFEMVVPGIGDQDDNDLEPDYDQDERAFSIDDIVEFFSNGDYADGVSENQQNRMRDDFYDWLNDEFSNYVSNNPQELNDRLVDTIIDDILDVNDFLEAAAEELTKERENKERDFDITKNEIISKARSLMKEYAQSCVEDETTEYHSVYDGVFDDMQSEFYDSKSEQDWLEDIGTRYMSDVASEFGFSWPHYTSAAGDIDTESIADDFSKTIGVSVNIGRGYHGATRESGKWIIEPDSSIDGDDSEDGGLEFISPPEPIATSIENMKKVWKWAASRGCYTNGTTGLHINISIPNYSRENLDYVKLAIFSGDNYVLTQFKRFANQYARSALGKIIDQTSAETAGNVLDTMRTKLNAETGSLVHKAYTDKYTSINVKNGWVEFRGPGGDYLSKTPEEITNTALRLAMALQIACDPSAYKQEYAKKLYTLMMSVKSAENETPDFAYWFLLYNMGKIGKADLISKVKALQQQRIAPKPKLPTTQVPKPEEDEYDREFRRWQQSTVQSDDNNWQNPRPRQMARDYDPSWEDDL